MPLVTFPWLSQAWSQSMPFLWTKSSSVDLFSSTLTLITTSDCPEFFLLSDLSSGRACRQGGHQVAQKSSSTVFPLRDSLVTVLPSRVWREKAGAGSPIFGAGGAAESPPAHRQKLKARAIRE